LIEELGNAYRDFSSEFIRENLAILDQQQMSALNRYITPVELIKVFVESLQPPLPLGKKELGAPGYRTGET